MVFVISGEGGAKTKDFCRDLGAAAYFEKPVDFEALRDSLAQALHSRRLERRKEVRVGLRVPLKLSGQDANGADFSLPSTTEKVSKGGFLCACAVVLTMRSTVDVYMLGTEQEHVGKARVVRAEWQGTQYPRYGFVFTEMIGHWRCSKFQLAVCVEGDFFRRRILSGALIRWRRKTQDPPYKSRVGHPPRQCTLITICEVIGCVFVS
jgi:hypothetical protein